MEFVNKLHAARITNHALYGHAFRCVLKVHQAKCLPARGSSAQLTVSIIRGISPFTMKNQARSLTSRKNSLEDYDLTSSNLFLNNQLSFKLTSQVRRFSRAWGLFWLSGAAFFRGSTALRQFLNHNKNQKIFFNTV